jgi:hypothetical protein
VSRPRSLIKIVEDLQAALEELALIVVDLRVK